MTTAADYRKRAAAVIKTAKSRKVSSDRAGLAEKAKALNEMADNEDWLAGKTEPKAPHERRQLIRPLAI